MSGLLKHVAAIGGDNIEEEFDRLKRVADEISVKMGLLLALVNTVARELAWSRLAIQAHPAAIGICTKFDALCRLHFQNQKSAKRLSDAILDLNAGVDLDLLTLHEVIMGHSAIDPTQPSLIVPWVQRVQARPDHQSADTAIRTYMDSLAQLQYRGAILVANAHVAYGEDGDADAALTQTGDRLAQQAALLTTVWP